jgi:hypothetical protein
MDNTLVFFQSPQVTMATNTFINVPIILQYEDIRLVEVVKVEKAGFTTQIPIYHPDGTYLAKAVGSRLFTTKDGEKAGLILKYPKDMTICELNGHVLFEIHRHGAASLRAKAELFTPDGAFVKCPDDLLPTLFFGEKEKAIHINGVTFTGNTFMDLRIGILIRKDGSVSFGVGYPKLSD